MHKNEATHNLTPGLLWPNTVFVCAFADAIQRVHEDCKNKHVINRAIIFFSKAALSVLFFSIIERSVLMVSVCYYKYMLGR